MGSLLSSVLGGSKLYIIIAVACFSAGFYTSSQFAAADQKKYLEVALKQQQKSTLKLIAESDELRALDQKIISEQQKEIEKIHKKRIYITKEVVKYVKNNTDCNLTFGALQLLNNARANDDFPRKKVSKTTQLTHAEKQATTYFTQPQEIENHADCALRYRALAAQHDNLIDWIEQNAQ